jgi:hypothetical protein
VNLEFRPVKVGSVIAEWVCQLKGKSGCGHSAAYNALTHFQDRLGKRENGLPYLKP